MPLDNTYTNEKESRRQPSQAGRPIQALDTRPFVIVQSNRQEGDKDEIESLGSQAVHETKVFAKGPVNGGKGLPPTEFVKEQNAGKNQHVRAEKALGHVFDVRRLIVDNGQGAERPHGGRQAHAPEGNEGQKASAFAAVEWRDL